MDTIISSELLVGHFNCYSRACDFDWTKVAETFLLTPVSNSYNHQLENLRRIRQFLVQLVASRGFKRLDPTDKRQPW